MSVDKERAIVEFAAPVCDAETEAFKAEIDARLVGFGSHKETLLSLLLNACDGDATAESLNPNRAWLGIEELASHYFAREIVKQTMMSNADREARCRAISNACQRARSLIDEAAQSPDLANNLIGAWWEGTSDYADAAGQFVDLLYIEREFNKVVKGLAALETAAGRAAEEVHQGRGRPKGTSVLPPDYIYALAGVYRKFTGRKPGAGAGPFARFVLAFRNAIGRDTITDAHLIDAIKDVRAHSLQNPSGWAPSPFDD